MAKVGFLTIGQSPRPDIVKDLPESLQDRIEIVEAGALDGLSKREIQRLKPSSEEILYVSRLKDGSQAGLSKEKITPLLHEKIGTLEKRGVDSILLLCSGEFNLRSRVTLIMPERIMKSTMEILNPRKLGVLIPEEDQMEYARKKWNRYSHTTIVVVAHSPYLDSEKKLYSKCVELKGCSAVLMDCMGYDEEHRRLVKQETGLPTLSTRSITFGFVETLYR